MLNSIAGMVGIGVQALIFAFVYAAAVPRRGRSIGALYAAVAAVNGYALLVLGAMTAGIRWQIVNAVLALALVVFLVSRARSREVLHRSPAAIAPLLRHSGFAIFLVLAAAGLQTTAVLLLPEVSVDGQLYHGPVLAQLIQTGWVWGWDAPNQYMYYTDLAMVGGLNLATFAGPTWFDNGVQVPHLIILILAIVAALRHRFAAPWVRVAFALLICAAPIVWLQPRILYVDLAYGAGVAVLALLAVERVRPARGDLLIAGVVAGSVLATKPSGLLTSLLLFIAFALIAVVRRAGHRTRPLRQSVLVLSVMALPCLPALGFYVRNLVTFGNPVYPVATTLGPLRLPGPVDLSIFASGERGSGFVDPGRLVSFADGIADGVVNGVTKLDYDARSGGFGHLPAVVVVIALVLVILQLVAGRREGRWMPGPWRSQLVLLALSAGVLLVQPSTFDGRYVIGPYVILCVVLLMAKVRKDVLRGADKGVAVIALALAVGQVVWTEVTMYPGLAAAAQMRALPDRWQAATPGNLWGRSSTVAWMPAEPGECVDIALETLGGVTPTGMVEQSQFGTLPYALYGESLCNRVSPMDVDAVESGNVPEVPLDQAEYLLLYPQNIERWRSLAGAAADCWVPWAEIPASEAYPQAVSVLRVACE